MNQFWQVWCSYYIISKRTFILKSRIWKFHIPLHTVTNEVEWVLVLIAQNTVRNNENEKFQNPNLGTSWSYFPLMYGIFPVMTFQSVKKSPIKTRLPPQAAAVGVLERVKVRYVREIVKKNNFIIIYNERSMSVIL